MVNYIIGGLFFLGSMAFAFMLASQPLDSEYTWKAENYQLPFIVPIETLDNSSNDSLCNDISFSQSAYQQCLYSVELIKPSMLRKVKIAIIDSGIDVDHYYFKGLISRKSKSFVDKNLGDEIDHGTAVAGILVKNLLALSLEEKKDIPFELLILKVVRKSTKKDAKYPYAANTDTIGEAIDYALSQGVSIINISLFGDETSKFQQEAFSRAEQMGVPVITAAGNKTTDLDSFPGYPCSLKYSNLYCVGNISSEGELAVSSNFGKSIKFYSIGEDIDSTVGNYSWRSQTGTSMATPKITAVMAFSRYEKIPVSHFYGKHYIGNPKDKEKIYVYKNPIENNNLDEDRLKEIK